MLICRIVITEDIWCGVHENMVYYLHYFYVNLKLFKNKSLFKMKKKIEKNYRTGRHI